MLLGRPLSEKKILEYWRDSLQDAILMSPELKDTYPVECEALVQGSIDTTIAERIIVESISKEARKRRKSSRDEQDSKGEQLPESVDVLVAPYIIERLRHGIQRGRNVTAVAAVWLPAKLNASGQLHPHPNFSPWIARELLEPSEKGALIIGTLEDYLKKFREQSFQPTCWVEGLTFVKALFQSVSGIALNTWLPAAYQRAKGIIMLMPEDRNAKGKILALCQYWLALETFPPLLQSMLGMAEKQAVQAASLSETIREKGHVGHIGEHGLNNEQRDVVRCAMQLNSGELLAVNGPPGTGKTTVLQGVMASFIVRAALLENKEPPIILATSINNQAVTNIIDTFTETPNTSDFRGTSYRWLPDVQGIGVRIPSVDAAKKEANKYQNFDELRQKLFNKATLEERRRHYLGCFSAWRSIPHITIEKAVTILHEELITTVKTLEKLSDILPRIADLHRRHAGTTLEEHRKTILEQVRTEETNLPWYCRTLAAFYHVAKKLRAYARSIGREAVPIEKACSATYAVIEDVTWWPKPLQHINTLKKDAATIADYSQLLCELRGNEEMLLDPFDFEQIRQHVDISLRKTAFDLAMRYWEGVFLTTTETWEDNWAGKLEQKRVCKTNLFKTMAMVTQCFVATVFKAADTFSYYNGHKQQAEPLEALVDLLIFDESGQVGAELGLPLLGLAKRALIVGDVEQLAPISVSEMTDIVRLAHNQVNDQSIAWLDQRGLSCSAGNVMRAAHHLTAFTDSYGTPGIMLRDHYRCLPEIIEFCNDLVYQGLLRPKRSPKPDAIFPALGYAHIRGAAEREGSSWGHTLEASTIAQWLYQHHRRIIEHYQRTKPDRQLDDIVAIVTPYRPQALKIMRELAKKFPSAIVDKLTVNTVHSLQGAERDIVIFSPTVRVYNVSLPFHDRDRRMLNVAVSRAKDSFLVFGDMELFRQDQNRLVTVQVAHVMLRSGSLLRPQGDPEGGRAQALPYRLPDRRPSDK
jgi:hypothetical protein